MSESRYVEDSRVTATASVTGPNKVGTVLRLLEQAIAEERTEAKRLVRRLIPLARDTWGEDRHALIAEAKEWLRRG